MVVTRQSDPDFVMLNFKMAVKILVILLVRLCLVTSYTDEEEGGSPRIVLGQKINITEVPWQVSFHRLVAPQRYAFFCGGAIIGPHEVLTAAHCMHMKNISTIIIRAGSTSVLEGGSVHQVEMAQVHPKYVCTVSKLQHDLAFVRVKEKFQFNKNVQPIKLSTKNPKNGEKVKVSGWGKTSPGYVNPPTDMPKNLRYAMLRVWDKNACYNYFKREAIKNFQTDYYCINNYKFGTREATCQGDSGSPVVLNGQLVGVVSSGLGKGEKDKKIAEDAKITDDTPCHMIDPVTVILGLQAHVCNDPKTIALYNSVVDHRKWISDMIRGLKKS